MKALLISLLALVSTALYAAAPPSSLDLKVERRTLDREERLNRPRKQIEELIRGIHITVKNNGAKPMLAGEVEWQILVKHAGKNPDIVSSGKETLNALGAAQSAQFTVGAVPVVERGSNEQDMEYQVVVKQGGAEVAKASSTQNFEAIAKNARSIDKKDNDDRERKGKKK